MIECVDLLGSVMNKNLDAQFQRSGPVTPEHTPQKRVVVDGAASLDRFVSGDASTEADMTGAEYFAIVAHVKENHSSGNELEGELLKMKTLKDKRRHLIAWIGEKYGTAAPPTMVPSNVVQASARPSTAHADISMSARNPLSEAQKERPATARTLAAQPLIQQVQPPDNKASYHEMFPVAESFASGRDHLEMNGGEYHGLIAWLKAIGHGDVEEQLLRVRLLGDKKLHLCKYLKELFISGVFSGQPSLNDKQFPQPQEEAEVWVDDQVPPPKYAPPLQSASQQAQPNKRLITNQSILALEQTLQRMEESFNFAVECMQSDMMHAREQLQQIRRNVHDWQM